VIEDPSLGDPLVPGLNYLRAEAVFAARYEMALTVDDVLAHRTRSRLLARDASAAAAGAVAELLGGVLNWTPEEQAAQVHDYRQEITREHDALEVAAPTGSDRAREPGWLPGVRLPGAMKR
jgi:glycerol-3-phosphate dehydrogenase